MIPNNNVIFSNIIYTPFRVTKSDPKIQRYIINKNATIIFWDDDTKTISKRHKDDVFDKELGFLFAYYYKKCGLTNASRKRVLNTIDYKYIKTFLFEMYVKNSGLTPEKARLELSNLVVDEKKLELSKKFNNKKLDNNKDNEKNTSNWLIEQFKKLDKRLEKLEIK